MVVVVGMVVIMIMVVMMVAVVVIVVMVIVLGGQDFDFTRAFGAKGLNGDFFVRVAAAFAHGSSPFAAGYYTGNLEAAQGRQRA